MGHDMMRHHIAMFAKIDHLPLFCELDCAVLTAMVAVQHDLFDQTICLILAAGSLGSI